MDRDDLYNRLLFLVPGAKFCFWPNDESGDTKGYNNVTIIDGWCVSWDSQNNLPIPSINEIMAVDSNLLSLNINSRYKFARDVDGKKDLALVAAFLLKKDSVPSLNFSDFLDWLELESKNL